MGFISGMSGRKNTVADAVERGRSSWRQVFGQPGTTKEEGGFDRFPTSRNRNSWVKGVVSESAAFKRLLQAMRSMAPGGWSDDRQEEARHFVGIAYTAIHRTGEQLAQSEFQLFRKDLKHPDGKKPVMPDDPPEGGRPFPPYKLVELLEKPNNDDDFGDLMYAWNQQLDLTGTALTWMVPNKMGIPYELYPIPTSIAIPQPAINPDYPDGFYRIQPLYPYGPFSSYPTPATAVGAPIPAQWMLRMKYTHPQLRYDGYAPLTAMRLHLDEIESMDRSRFYSMKRVINPSAVLQMDEMEGATSLPDHEIERIRAEFENDHQGPENFGRLFISPPGGKLEPWATALKDMEYKDGWDQLVSFVLGAGFGITKPAAGMIEDSSYSTLFATLKQLWLLTLGPKCRRMSSKLTRHLAPFFGDDLIIEIRPQRIDDHELTKQKVDTLMQAKAITKNEVRKEMDFAITEEEWGEEIAGAESQEGQEQGGIPGMGGAPPGAEQGIPVPPQVEDQGAGQAGGEEQQPEAEEVVPESPEGIEAPEAPQEAEIPELENPEDEEDFGWNGVPKAPNVSGNEFEGTKPEPPEVTSSRPKPGNLGRGALGPRKALVDAMNGVHIKSLREQILDACRNGH